MFQLRNSEVTMTLIAVNIAWFLVEIHNGFTTGGLIKSGAQDYNDVVLGGQWWRILSAMFVHGGYAHIAVNMISLAFLGVVEPFVGRMRYVITYFASGILGNLAEVFLGNHQVVSMGASGAIMGVFGIALVMALHKDFPRGVLYQLLFWLALNLVIGFTAVGIANTAHITGIVTGGIAVELMFYRRSRRLWTWLIGIATALATLLLASTYALAGTNSTDSSILQLITDQNRLAAIEQTSASVFNDAANGKVASAAALVRYRQEHQQLTSLMAATKSHEGQAPRHLNTVFGYLYQSESYWQEGLGLLIQSGGKPGGTTDQAVSNLFNQSVQADNHMYQLAQPYGVQRQG